ncbi:MAG TPA: hypothetical protein VH414_13590 [Lichenihabitans sp.]|nr:hypothetical protein [Lichenihabitans sp.]
MPGGVARQQAIARDGSMGADEEIRKRTRPCSSAAAMDRKALARQEGRLVGIASRWKTSFGRAVSSSSALVNRTEISAQTMALIARRDVSAARSTASADQEYQHLSSVMRSSRALLSARTPVIPRRA